MLNPNICQPTGLRHYYFAPTKAGREFCQYCGYCKPYTKYDVKYLPVPNQVTAIIDPVQTPPELTATAFVFPIMRDRSLVMARNTRRGLEIAGGHVEAGETLEQAARREALEEGLCKVPVLLTLGHLQMTTGGPKPEGYKYPYPVSYQQFFTGIVEGFADYVGNDECFEPELIAPGDLPEVLDPGMMDFYNEAVRLLGL